MFSLLSPSFLLRTGPLSLTDGVLFISLTHILCFLLKRALLFFRDSVAEMLFEQDNEEKSIATLLLDTLVKVQNMS